MGSKINWNYREDFIGLSTENKPNNNVDGSTFYEVDTGKFYVMYKNNWYLQGESEEPVESEE